MFIDPGPAGATPERKSILARLRHYPAGVAGGVTLLLLVAGGLLLPVIGPYDPAAQVSPPLLAPSAAHWFGTDELGRDILTRVVAGAPVTLATAIGAALIAAGIGAPLGILAGYLGGWVDSILARFTDFVLSIPGILLALVIVALLGASLANLTLAIGIGAFPAFTRLARASTLTIRERAFVQAARSMGASSLDIMVRTVAPNVFSPLMVQVIITASVAVLVAASLSFLGLGAPPPAPSWGGMLQVSRAYVYDAPLYGVFPGLALMITVASFDAIGRSLMRATGTKSVGGITKAGAH
jgi:peptide/nickel transport system permease protein